MGKTRGVFKKIRDTEGTFHVKMGTMKDRNGMDLTQAGEKAMATHSSVLAWRILTITLLACEMSAWCSSLSILWHCLSLGLE